jgi:hypothetical protein
MATPRVLGQLLRLAANYKLLANEATQLIAEGADLMLSTRRLHERLVCSATTSDDTDHTTARAGEDLLGTGWELDTGLALIRVVADDGNVVAGGTTERTTVTRLVLDVGEDGTFGNGVEGQDVADGESGVLSGVDELDTVSAMSFLCASYSPN